MSTTTTTPIPSFPFERENPLHPPEAYRELRLNAPVTRVRIWDGSTPWLVSRYDDVRFVLSDRRFSADQSLPGYPGSNESMTRVRERYPTFVTMDNPDHQRYRRLLTKDFSVRRVEELRPSIRRSVHELIAALREKQPPADFIDEFALAVPSQMICMLLGVPYEDHELFQRLTRIMASGHSTPEETERATEELCEGYLRKLIRRKQTDAGDDILSGLVTGPMSAGEVTEDEVVSLARLLLVAGHDTTASMIGLSTFSLLIDPALRRVVVEEPDLVPAVVEDLLRFWNIDNFGLSRVALEDVEVGGCLIRAGEGVLTAGPSADRDETVFTDPDRVDPHRKNLRAHTAFGYGIHQCLGQNLARVELQESLRELFVQLPTLELDVPPESVSFDYHMFNYGVQSMPVRW